MLKNHSLGWPELVKHRVKNLTACSILPSLCKKIRDEGNRFRIGVPQRVEPPKDLNTPARVDDATLLKEESSEGGTEDGIKAASPSKKDAKSASAFNAVSRRQVKCLFCCLVYSIAASLSGDHKLSCRLSDYFLILQRCSVCDVSQELLACEMLSARSPGCLLGHSVQSVSRAAPRHPTAIPCLLP